MVSKSVLEAETVEISGELLEGVLGVAEVVFVGFEGFERLFLSYSDFEVDEWGGFW